MKDAAFALQSELAVLVHGVLRKHGWPLELSSHAQLGDPAFRELRQIVKAAFQVDRTLVGPGLPRDHVHQRGLTGAVGPDDASELAVVEHERDVVDGLEAVEADGQLLHPQGDRRPARQNVRFVVRAGDVSRGHGATLSLAAPGSATGTTSVAGPAGATGSSSACRSESGGEAA